MRLHYKGKYDLNPESLPHGQHMPGAVPFKEAKDSKQLSLIANAASVVIMVLLAVPAYFRCREFLCAGRVVFWRAAGFGSRRPQSRGAQACSGSLRISSSAPNSLKYRLR